MADRAREATRRGLQFLAATIGSDGAWPSECRRGSGTDRRVRKDNASFVAGLGVLALEGLGERTRDLRDRSCDWILAGMVDPGVWQYLPHLPPDTDCTAICSLAIRNHPHAPGLSNVVSLLSEQESDGVFRTWMTVKDPWAASDHIDSVVNANVLTWLGPGPEMVAAEEWISGVIAEGHEPDSTYFYTTATDLHYAVAKAHARWPRLFEPVIPIVTRRLRKNVETAAGDAIRSAQALTALGLLGAMPAFRTAAAAWEKILGAQRHDGGWPDVVLWAGPLPPAP